MKRIAFTMQIKPGYEEEYKKRHNPIWQELAAKLKEHGVANYSIFRQGLNLLAFAEIESQERWDDLAHQPIARKWWDYMAPLMEVNPDNSPVFQPAVEVFHLD